MTTAEYQKTYGMAPNISATSTQPKPPTSLGQKVLNTGTAVANFFGAKGIAEDVGATIASAKAAPDEKQYIQHPDLKERIGSTVQFGTNFIPGVGEGAGLAAKVGAGLGTGYAFDVGSKLQDNKTTGEALTPGIGTLVGGALPVAGAVLRPATKIVGRLLKGLGSGLSGVSSDTIDKIVDNPDVAQKASQKLAASGNNKVLEENAKTLVNGVSKIQNEASSAYRSGLDKLSETDIKPENLKKGFFSALEKHNISVDGSGKIDFSNAEFLDPKMQQRAEGIINKINQQSDLSGTGVRKLMDVVDNSKFKSAPDGDRQAFNAFIGDLKNGLKDGISASTDKLNEINSKYSSDMQLSEAAQNIFGKVNFKNLPEVARAAKKLEGLFSQKGLDPQVIDDYLTRIGVSPSDFKTSEAVRQISNKTESANSVGTSFGEVMRSATSSLVTPNTVKNLSIATGMAKEKLIPFLRALMPSARNVVIQALLSANQDSSGSNQPR